ncbi:MAG: phosphate ABC transporter ATP-binding protein PstB [Desulfotomaculales bacterium]
MGSSGDEGPAPREIKIRIRRLSAWYGACRALTEITLDIPAHSVTAVIGPSGCGKSTLVRCLNRLHEEFPGAQRSGSVFLDDLDIYGPLVDPIRVRRRIGMVFQRPNPFPTMSIFDNVAVGLRLHGLARGEALAETVRAALKRVGLWKEVRGQLHRSGVALSGGQQQRLCLARALAVNPEVLLLDEPCASLDPVSSMQIEELIRQLKETHTVVVVTHNIQQAARLADYTVFLLHGALVEAGPTARLFTRPADRRTEDYLAGRFG